MADSKSAKTAKKSANEVKATKSTGAKKDFSAQVMQMWGASIVVAILLVLVLGVQTFFTAEEAAIRRESYLANLDQLYQQEVQECFNLAAAVEGGAAPETAGECLDRINNEGRYAELIRKWGGEEFLLSDLSEVQ